MSTQVYKGVFRSKVVEIQAIQYTPDLTCEELFEWAGVKRNTPEDPFIFSKGIIYISTPEGQMEVPMGWWIIKGLIGEFYPCKNEVFVRKYEFVRSSM